MKVLRSTRRLWWPPVPAPEATRSAIEQLAKAPAEPTFVRQFAYPVGAAYGILLDEYAPGWTHRIKPGDDLGKLIEPFAGPPREGFGSRRCVLWRSGDPRAGNQARCGAQGPRCGTAPRFVEGPILVLPRGRGASFWSTGMTPIPGEGTVYSLFRTTVDWGTLEASAVLVDRIAESSPFPPRPVVEGKTLKGDGWTVTLRGGLGHPARPSSR